MNHLKFYKDFYSFIFEQSTNKVKIDVEIKSKGKEEVVEFANLGIYDESDKVVKAGSGDDSGKFSFVIKPGKYKIKCSSTGFVKSEQTYDLDQDKTITIELEEVVKQTSEVEIESKKINVEVYDKETKSPIPNASYKIKRGDEVLEEGTTDDKGVFSFKAANDVYKITLNVEGFKKTTRKFSFDAESDYTKKEINKKIGLESIPEVDEEQWEIDLKCSVLDKNNPRKPIETLVVRAYKIKEEKEKFIGPEDPANAKELKVIKEKDQDKLPTFKVLITGPCVIDWHISGAGYEPIKKRTVITKENWEEQLKKFAKGKTTPEGDFSPVFLMEPVDKQTGSSEREIDPSFLNKFLAKTPNLKGVMNEFNISKKDLKIFLTKGDSSTQETVYAKVPTSRGLREEGSIILKFAGIFTRESGYNDSYKNIVFKRTFKNQKMFDKAKEDIVKSKDDVKFMKEVRKAILSVIGTRAKLQEVKPIELGYEFGIVGLNPQQTIDIINKIDKY